MIEISLWVPVFLLEFLAVAALIISIFAHRGKVKRRALQSEVTRLKEEMAARVQEVPDAPVEIEAADSEPEETADGPAKLVLLSQEDVEAASVPAAPSEESASEASSSEETASEGSASEETASEDSASDESSSEESAPEESPASGGEEPAALCAQLLEKNEMLTNALNSVLERSAELGMKLGNLKGSSNIDEDGKALVQEMIDHTRDSDEVLVDASDKGMEVDETVRHMQTLLGSVKPVQAGQTVDHVSLNEILMARADGQTEEELARLREEVRQRLLAPDPAPGNDGGGDAQALAELGEQVTSLQSQLSREQSERRSVEQNLVEITEEYQRLFEQFQPTA